ncbi:hypothetical protein [Phenylobacterium sp.]|uniref:hypothetical protein n=1 Tax=Phenylobacterium sp. TaxID=1871053 RepID=UPI0037C6E353
MIAKASLFSTVLGEYVGSRKIKLRRVLATTAAAVALTAAGGAAETVSVGGYDFADNAFVNDLVGSQGAFNVIGHAFPAAITDIDAGTIVFSWLQDVFLDLGFSDRAAVKGAGADLMIFELGGLDPIHPTTNGVVRDDTAAFPAASNNLNAVVVDLSPFGIAPMSMVASFRIETPRNLRNAGASDDNVASRSLIGAFSLGSLAPETGQRVLMILGFGMVGARMRLWPTSAA